MENQIFAQEILDKDQGKDTRRSLIKQASLKQASFKKSIENNEEEEEAILDKHLAKRWGLMYCGGAKVVENIVREVGTKHGIEFRIENFGW